MYSDLEPKQERTDASTQKSSMTSFDTAIDSSYEMQNTNKIPLLAFLQSNTIPSSIMIWKLFILLLDILTIILLISMKRWLTWLLLLPFLLFLFVIDLDSYDFLYWVNAKLEDLFHFKSLLNVEFEFVVITSILCMMVLNLLVGGWDKSIFWLFVFWAVELAAIRFGNKFGVGSLTRFDKTDIHTMQNNEDEGDKLSKL